MGKRGVLIIGTGLIARKLPDVVMSITWDDVKLRVGDNEIKVISGGREERAIWKW